MRPLETFKKVVRKIKANPFERFCRLLDFFAYPFKPLANPLKALEKPLTSRSLAVSFYPLNTKPLVYVFLEKVTYVRPPYSILVFAKHKLKGSSLENLS